MTSSTPKPNWKMIPSSRKEESSLMVEFSPEVRRCFSRLEEAVGANKHFPNEMLENLQELAQGKPMQVARAITAVAYITQATTKHVALTSDASASEALAELFEALSADDKRPVRTGKAISRRL
jgi:hypothetical protein